ncbi:hypothetical protein E2C01_085274 [Portunus trituberculatus]|uniref:Uncharacterized protein n=1 Tax=Portunus trituberculatus TaxID=210409 RepID=A0A5B7JA13_PORTR|nr:hypothetical protein [Portunus trituberculatus]
MERGGKKRRAQCLVNYGPSWRPFTATGKASSKKITEVLSKGRGTLALRRPHWHWIRVFISQCSLEFYPNTARCVYPDLTSPNQHYTVHLSVPAVYYLSQS